MGTTLSLNKFNIGLISDKLSGSSSYPSSLAQAQNVILEPTGPARKRGGFKYLMTTSTDNTGALLFPFVYSNSEVALFIVSQGKIEVYNPKTNTITYTQSFTTSDILSVQMFQIQDVVYLCSIDNPPKKFIRTNKNFTTWSFTDVDFLDGPYDPENTTQMMFKISGSTNPTEGTTAVGTAFTLEATNITADQPLSSFVGRWIRLLTISGQTSGWSWFKVTSTSGNSLSCTYQGGNGYANYNTRMWKKGAIGNNTYPTCCCIHEGRMCYAMGKTVYLSKANAYDTFTVGQKDGTTQVDDAITATLAMNKSSTIKWLVSDHSLVCGCDGSEYVIKADDYGSALTPLNATGQLQTTNGSDILPGIPVSGGIIYVNKFGKKVIFNGFDSSEFRYTDLNLSMFNEEITDEGIVDMTFQHDPYPILWLVTASGKLVAQTLDMSNNLYAFSKIETDGEVLSVCSLPNSVIGTDTLYALVRRNGQVNLEAMYEGISPVATTSLNEYYSDSCKLVESSTPTKHFSGFDHLKGKEVVVLADGAIQPNVTVDSNGCIDIQYASKKVIAGLPYTMIIQPSPVGIEQVMIDAKKKNISSVSVRLYKSVGLKAGYDNEHIYECPFRNTNDAMDAPLPLHTGLLTIPFRNTWNKEGGMVFISDQPLPFELLQLIFNLTLGD